MNEWGEVCRRGEFSLRVRLPCNGVRWSIRGDSVFALGVLLRPGEEDFTIGFVDLAHLRHFCRELAPLDVEVYGGDGDEAVALRDALRIASGLEEVH